MARVAKAIVDTLYEGIELRDGEGVLMWRRSDRYRGAKVKRGFNMYRGGLMQF